MNVSVKEFYRTVDFATWSDKEGLNPDEMYVIEKYLDKGAKTVEAGTAGGRIVLEMKNMGFSSLSGYDFVPEFIERAKLRDSSHSINFEVGDATGLNYEDSSFDQIVYLQQIISTIDDAEGRQRAFQEAHRILKTEGTALFSFLSSETKTGGIMYPLYLTYLSIIRKMTGINRSAQYFPYPYSSKNGTSNWHSILLGSGPYLYRYKLQEVYQAFNEVGFKILAIGSREQIFQGKMYSTLEEMSEQPIKGAIYFVCTK
jgi:SAM-dependent methyltransferase